MVQYDNQVGMATGPIPTIPSSRRGQQRQGPSAAGVAKAKPHLARSRPLSPHPHLVLQGTAVEGQWIEVTLEIKQ